MSEKPQLRRFVPNRGVYYRNRVRDRPKPNFRLNVLHRGLRGFSVLLAVVVPIYFWAQTDELGGILPMHYNIAGDVNREGSVTEAGITLVVVGFLTIGLVVLSHYPRIFNYPTMLTEDNVQRLYKTAVQMVIWIAIGSALLTVVIAGNWLGSIGISWIWLPLGLMISAVATGIVRMFRRG